MPEREKPSLLEALVRAIIERALGGLNRYVERIMKRILRAAGLYIAGLVVSLAGLLFLAVGVVKWLAMIVPSWLAWLIVGLVMFLLGAVLTLATFVASRS